MTKGFYKIMLFSLLLATVACGGDRRPVGILDEETMVNILTEAYAFEGYAAISSDFDFRKMDAEVVGFYDNLFEKYNTTSETFDQSIDYYFRHKHYYETIQNQVLDNLRQMQKQ